MQEKLPELLRLTITRVENCLDWFVGDTYLKALLKEVELGEVYCLTLVMKKMPSCIRYQSNKHVPMLMQLKWVGSDACAFCRGSHPHKECRKLKDVKEGKMLIQDAIAPEIVKPM